MNTSYHRQHKHVSSRNGFSLLELLVVLAILGILLSVGFSQLKPPAARALAGSVKATIQQARFEAIKRNRAVAVVFYADKIELRVNSNSQAESCELAATELLRTLDWRSYGTVQVHKKRSDATPNDLYWLPSGQARFCRGGFYADTVAVTAQNARYHVVTNQGARTYMKAVH